MNLNGSVFLIYFAIALFVLALICLILAIAVLLRQAINRNIQAITDSTTKLAEKGITEGVSGLVGNASLLITSLNDMSKTTTGIGIFMVFLSIVLGIIAYFILQPFVFPS